MHIVIREGGSKMFGEYGPEAGDIGEVITFVFDDIDDVYFATKFHGFEGIFWIPADRCSGAILKRSWQKPVGDV